MAFWYANEVGMLNFRMKLSTHKIIYEYIFYSYTFLYLEIQLNKCQFTISIHFITIKQLKVQHYYIHKPIQYFLSETFIVKNIIYHVLKYESKQSIYTILQYSYVSTLLSNRLYNMYKI